MELVFHFGAPPTAAGESSAQPHSLIAGQLTTALHLLQPLGSMDALGVRLRPEASACLLPPRLLAGTFHALATVTGQTWARQTRDNAGAAHPAGLARVQAVIARLRLILRAAPAPDAAVAHSVRLIERSHGRGPMEQFIPDGMRARQWQRRFAAATGLTPKAFARIARLQHLVALYESRQFHAWAALALEAGFYDQSHLANEFRSFAGQSPEAFFQAGRGMAEFYRDVFFQDAGRARG